MVHVWQAARGHAPGIRAQRVSMRCVRSIRTSGPVILMSGGNGSPFLAVKEVIRSFSKTFVEPQKR